VTDDYVSKRDITFRVGERDRRWHDCDPHPYSSLWSACDPVSSQPPLINEPVANYFIATALSTDSLRTAPVSINALGEMHYSEDAIRLNCVPTNRWKCLATWLTNNRITYNYVNHDCKWLIFFSCLKWSCNTIAFKVSETKKKK